MNQSPSQAVAQVIHQQIAAQMGDLIIANITLQAQLQEAQAQLQAARAQLASAADAKAAERVAAQDG